MAHRFIAAAALAAASIAVPALAQPQVSPVDVTPNAPTSITISLSGKTHAAVRDEIRVASKTVCRNAVTNHELTFIDVAWCAGRTQDRALRRFSAIVRRGQFADSGVIRLAARD